MINYNSTNPVIIQFPRFAGGKFLSNCLSLSQCCVPQDRQLAEYLIDHPDNYEYRFNKLLLTLPPADKMVNWINQFELGDNQLYGPAHISWRHGLKNTPVNDTTVKLSNSNLKFFIVCHSGPDEILKILKVWPNARIIMLKNYREFYNISSTLKSNGPEPIENHAGNYHVEKYNLLKGDNWPSWEEFESDNYISTNLEIQEYYHWHLVTNPVIPFDIDNSIFNKEQFLKAMAELYDVLGFDDYNQNLVGNFWQSYITLHVDTSNKII